MGKDEAFAALERHFEQHYGKIDTPKRREKKRKRDQTDVIPEEHEQFEDADEWHGIDNAPPAIVPKIITFTEPGTSDDEVSAPSAFLVRPHNPALIPPVLPNPQTKSLNHAKKHPLALPRQRNREPKKRHRPPTSPPRIESPLRTVHFHPPRPLAPPHS
jgi:hypothetical protein